MRTTTKLVIASLVLLPAVMGLGAADPELPYNDSTPQGTEYDNWTENRTEPDLVNVSHYVSRLGPAVVGGVPGDAGSGGLALGLAVSAFGLLYLGQSRAGVVASGTLAVLTVAALSAPGGAGLLPRWLYGVAVMLVALLLASRLVGRLR
jgi:hypothetical protein